MESLIEWRKFLINKRLVLNNNSTAKLMTTYIISDKQSKVFLRKLEISLFKKSKKKLTLSNLGRNNLPSEPGVYAIFEREMLVYIGETGNIRRRIRDMRNTRNHQLRRNVGGLNFSKIKGYRKADSRTKFPAKIEKRLNRWIENKFKIRVLPLYLGRKEFEEYIYEEYKPKYNQKGRRK